MADIVVTDPEVSRQHARLTRTDGGYEIQDLGSTNGTFLDGQRLRGEPQPLSPGQVIKMGSNVSLVYEGDGADVTGEEAAVGPSPFAEPEEAPEDVVEEDVVARTPMEYGEDEELSELPSFEEDDELFPALEGEELPSFSEPEDELPSFDEIEAPSFGETTFEEEAIEVDYEEAREGAEEVLPSFDKAGEEVYTPERETVSPPPPPPGPPPSGNNRNRNILIAILALVFICCCCAFALYIGYVYVGDILGCYFIDGYPNC
jgi:predicted component of type VI protein secretion system